MVKDHLGYVGPTTVAMGMLSFLIRYSSSIDGDVPATPSRYAPGPECVWEYELLGLWSIGRRLPYFVLLLMGSNDRGCGLRGRGGHYLFHSLWLCSKAPCREEKEISKLVNES